MADGVPMRIPTVGWIRIEDRSATPPTTSPNTRDPVGARIGQVPDFLPALRRSTADLIDDVAAEGWTDADVAAPSLCTGWTRGHVLTHLARNADGIAATLEGALRNEIVERYPRGWNARNQDIDDGAPRPIAAQLADLRATAQRLDAAFDAIDQADAWDRPTAERSVARDWVWRRLREVEIHRVDLRGSYTADQWPTALLALQIPQALDTLGERIDRPVHVEIESVSVPELDGLSWTGGPVEGEPTVVRGPDWAVLAWLVGRPAAAEEALTATPPLGPWR